MRLAKIEKHLPVMTKEVIAYLSPQKNGIYLDLTLGSGGHSQALLEKQPKSMVIAFDQDQEAINRCQQNSFFARQRITLVNDNFVNFPQYLASSNITQVDGFIFDLGLSSEQLADVNRGFSYRQDAPLDMRMSQQGKLTAQEIINYYQEEKLATIFFNYGEEPRARQIAKKICHFRQKQKIINTQQLVQIITRSPVPKTKKHPARRIFQALRIAVNQELTSLHQALEKAIMYLKEGGTIVVISYHSLEDRIIKQTFKKHSSTGNFQVLTKKPLLPTQEEIISNYRARSAKLRVLTRLK